MGHSTIKRRLWIGAAIALVLLVAAIVAFAASTWSEVNRVTIDRPPAVPSGGATASEDPDESSADDEESRPEESPFRAIPDEEVRILLLVGSDSREDLEDPSVFGEFDGQRADVVMVLIKGRDSTAILSLPRDLWIENRCTGGKSRLSEMLEGCDEFNGPTLLTLTVESLIGQTVDHFALVDLAGFPAAVDAVGGYEICLERPVRDQKANLELPAGCTLADGEQTLAWLRSRRTQELTADGWRIMPGVNDLVRNERQRKFIVDMLGHLSDFSSPQDIAAAAQAVAPFVTVDSELGLVSAVNLAWTMRGLESGEVEELDVPVYDFVTEDGAAVLKASTPVEEIVAAFLAPETAEAEVLKTG